VRRGRWGRRVEDGEKGEGKDGGGGERNGGQGGEKGEEEGEKIRLTLTNPLDS
jgi:hypothetical protein